MVGHHTLVKFSKATRNVASDVAGSFILPGPRALSQRSKSIGEEFGASDYCVAPVH